MDTNFFFFFFLLAFISVGGVWKALAFRKTVSVQLFSDETNVLMPEPYLMLLLRGKNYHTSNIKCCIEQMF